MVLLIAAAACSHPAKPTIILKLIVISPRVAKKTRPALPQPKDVDPMRIVQCGIDDGPQFDPMQRDSDQNDLDLKWKLENIDMDDVVDQKGNEISEEIEKQLHHVSLSNHSCLNVGEWPDTEKFAVKVVYATSGDVLSVELHNRKVATTQARCLISKLCTLRIPNGVEPGFQIHGKLKFRYTPR
jgi:hypothetical protein